MRELGQSPGCSCGTGRLPSIRGQTLLSAACLALGVACREQELLPSGPWG